MAGFLGIGGKNSKQQNQAIGNLNNLYNFGFNTAKKGTATGQATTAAGLEGVSNANDYFRKLVSGNRAAQQQAQAPAINATLSASDAAKRQQAQMGTARGGGVAGANQQREDQTRAQIDNALFATAPGAATQEAATSGKIADIGTMQGEQALQALGISGTSTAQAGDIATQARQQQAQATQQIIKDVFGWG